MESPLPFALRVTAGVVATSLDTVRRLPAELPTLPVTVMGRLAKLSFQLNQQLAELATAGDRLIATLNRDEQPPERTAWSTIDEEDEVAQRDPQAAATWDTVADAVADAADGTAGPDYTAGPHGIAGTDGTAGFYGTEGADGAAVGAIIDDPFEETDPPDVTSHDAVRLDAGVSRAAALADPALQEAFVDPVAERTDPAIGGWEPAEDASSAAPRGGRRPRTPRPMRAVPDLGSDLEPDLATAHETELGPQRAGPARQDPPSPAKRRQPGRTRVEEDRPMDGDTGATTDDLTRGLVDDVQRLENEAPPAKSTRTLAQLRADLQAMTIDDLRAALEEERQGRARPAHLTLLSNRLSTLGQPPE